MSLTLILGDQLHRHWLSPSPLELAVGGRVLNTFVAMRSFRDALIERGHDVRYFELPASDGVPFWGRLTLELAGAMELRVAEIADRGFAAQVEQFCGEQAVQLSVLPSPAFLESVVRTLITTHFDDHPGELGDLWIPFDHAGGIAWLKGFLRQLAPCWWEGRTGLPPLDAAIGRVKRLGYNHHIERNQGFFQANPLSR